MKSISVQHISKTYLGKSPVNALKNINLEIAKGELFGLIGPDGAGKTTLFRILTTLLLADDGTASVEGLDVVKDYKEIRNKVGYMPGKFSLYQDLTIEENLNFFADVFGTTVEENYDQIKDIYIQIEPFKDRRAGNLSGGMKQKLALCCALVHKPQVLFLDEPTTGVDPVSRKEFWDMLQNLKQQNITIMVSTPYMDEAGLCDRIALIQLGSILTINTPGQIVSEYPVPLYAVQSNNNYKLLSQLRSNTSISSCYMFGEYLHITFEKEVIEIPNVKMQQITPGIEDCFIKLMTQYDQGNNSN